MIEQDIFTNSKEHSKYFLLTQLGVPLGDTLLAEQMASIEKIRESDTAAFYTPTVFEGHYNHLLSQVVDAYLRSKNLDENKRDDIYHFLSNAAEVYGEIRALARGFNNPADDKKAVLYNSIHDKMLKDMLALKFDNSEEDNQHINKFSRLTASQIIKKINDYCGSNPNYSASLKGQVVVQTPPPIPFMAGWGGWFIALVAFVAPIAIAVVLPPMSFGVSVFLGAVLGFCAVGLLFYVGSKIRTAANQYNQKKMEFDKNQKQELIDPSVLSRLLAVDEEGVDAPAVSDNNNNSSAAVVVSLVNNGSTLYGNSNSGVNLNNKITLDSNDGFSLVK